MKSPLAIFAVASCIMPLCQAASPPRVPESLLACRKLQDDGERVRCYDAQISKLIAASSAGTAPAAPAARTAPAAQVSRSASSTPATTPAPQFGAETLPPTAHSKSQPQEDAALLSSITALHKASSGTYTISLANGQVWRQEESSQVAQFLRVGDDVRIEKAALGSYHMSTASTGTKNWVRVTRIQ